MANQSIATSVATESFSFENFSVRAINRNGEIWFVAADVGAVLDIDVQSSILLHKGVQSPLASGYRTRQLCGFFVPGRFQRREGDGYNTRKGKKSTRLATGFEPPGTLMGLGQSGSMRFENSARSLP